MNNKICKGCGQANHPAAAVCTNCGLNLPQVNSNPFAAEDDPLKTIAVGQNQMPNFSTPIQNEPKPEKKSSKMLWILGGVGALVLIGGFLIVALGAGVYFYQSGSETVEVTSTPAEEKSEKAKDSGETKKDDDDDEPEKDSQKDEADPVLVKMTDGDINKHIEGKLSNLGVYKLAKSGTPKKKTFESSNAEQYGLYVPKNDRKEFVLFSMATFPSVRQAKDFVADKAAQIKSEGGKIITHTDKEKSDVLLYNEKKAGGQIIDCKDGVCIYIIGSKAKHTSGFYTAYFKR